MNLKIMTMIGAVGSWLAGLFGGWVTSLQTLLIFKAIDWFTGGFLLPAVFKKSPKSENGTLESRAGWKGLYRKGKTKERRRMDRAGLWREDRGVRDII